MIKHITIVSLVVILFSTLCIADVFKHRKSGEVFYGYPTNKSLGAKTRIYVEKDGKFNGKTIIIEEYDITYSPKGRKANVIVIGIDDQNILLSDTVSNSLAKTIIEGANKGPRCILLKIDSPGGRGDCMKKVCDAIKKTSNCPVIAFITGKKYGGAFSAAAGVALACDTIYISPDAQMGTIAPQVNATANRQSMADWQATFTPTDIAMFGGYLSTLAESKNRPGDMAMAIIDQSIEIIEVVIDEQGSRNIVSKANKQPKDAVVKTWSKTMIDYSPKKDSNKQDEAEEQTVSRIIISAEDAIYTKMADAIARSQSDVIEALEASDAKILLTTRIKTEVKKFTKNRGMAYKYFQDINELERQVVEIEKQMKSVATEGRKNMPSREDERLKRMQQDMYLELLNGKKNKGQIIRGRFKQKRARNSLSDDAIAGLQRDINNTYVNPYVLEYQRLTYELAYVLNGLIERYSKVSKIANKYPGALPEGQTLQDLRQKFNAAANRRDMLGYY